MSDGGSDVAIQDGRDFFAGTRLAGFGRRFELPFRGRQNNQGPSAVVTRCTRGPIHLLEKYKIGHAMPSREPFMVLTFLDGASIEVQMPGRTAQEIGLSLIHVGNASVLPEGAKPS